MNIYITLDYELFFGSKSGTVEKCILEPTEELLKLTNPYGIKFTCFVDSGYLLALEKFKSDFRSLKSDYEKITQQIRYLADNGHGVELHIHPHWEDSYYDGAKWVFHTERYRLSNFSEEEIIDIISRYTKVLERISGKSPQAYRAGGWSAQPFGPIGKGLKKNGVLIDSTVYPGGKYLSNNQSFDFSRVDQYKTKYKFSNDLVKEDENGEFTEIPISSYKVPPWFFWKFVLIKFSKQSKHKAYGDGSAIKMAKSNVLKLLFSFSHSVVSIDGYKASLLNKAFRRYRTKTANNGNMVLIGHPKAFTRFSLKKLSNFMESTYRDHNYKTYQ
ncbi:polysaccharide deacetylase family protein [Flagellimonas myxillae]|uniref:polysaccharide deacetylase family protein n=1 Tax=Flagellimonas myxillae TaxID=2942214 RepID=UPI00201F6158|nr:polysaccharide deacetylase family protein [Muricauda myxillae]MCL6266674.1 polysaccharide deacetylase family protein [Muricauda myxillae]